MSFEVAAQSYDRFMGRFSVPLAERFAAFAAPPPGALLDVGCGPGALTAVLARRAGEEQLSGVDPSESFAAAASARFPLADIRRASAEALPFADAVFSATLAQLVVHFMADADAGAREMLRVTRPGGVVAACVWDFAGGRAPQSLFFSALADVVDDVEDESHRVGAHRGDLRALLEKAGCGEVTEAELSVQVPIAGFDDWWEPYTLGVAPAGRQLAALSPADRERVRAAARPLVPDGHFSVTATAWAARGLRPA
ncbi:class I SAM-dependent methyltransferase [Microbacterium fluvii]|uniref:Class I SAM-dependent methyltransferase n=1 Tax=Microbacterium fluvii TaxID=415215 RepID=A0ABW2HEP7_9MICO|nr:class I SAM-dependent methyltransferase [Microbacterium fluvii]MCU4673419.1 class I SAM-dependent methyltransferase [Microbacterium fluvii]